MIKSNNDDLRKRGMVEQQDIDKVAHLPYSELIKLIQSKSSVERSSAIRVLSSRGSGDDLFIGTLLKRLCIEKSLYTRIEICAALQRGNIETAMFMIGYLGVIGSNQHKTLPGTVSKKISYPLPRDIIARTLAKMNVSVFPAMLEVLCSKDTVKISEVIDAIGFMVFYNQELSSIQNLKNIINTMSLYSDNEIIYWKSTICLSAFPIQESIDLLNDIVINNKYQIIKEEALRSKNLILLRN